MNYRAKSLNTPTSSTWLYGEVHVDCKRPHIHTHGLSFPIDVKTIGLYSGLEDKDGRKIYDGDIIEWYELKWVRDDLFRESESYIKKMTDVVVFVDGCFCLRNDHEYFLKWMTKDYRVREPDEHIFDSTTNLDEFPFIKTENDLLYCKVIGNKYDNPSFEEQLEF